MKPSFLLRFLDSCRRRCFSPFLSCLHFSPYASSASQIFIYSILITLVLYFTAFLGVVRRFVITDFISLYTIFLVNIYFLCAYFSFVLVHFFLSIIGFYQESGLSAGGGDVMGHRINNCTCFVANHIPPSCYPQRRSFAFLLLCYSC